MNLVFWHGQKEVRLNLEEKDRNAFQVSLGKKKYNVTVEFLSPKELLLNMDGKVYNIIINANLHSYSVFVNERFFNIEKKSAQRILKEKRGTLRKKAIQTSMPGRIVRILVMEGERVDKGQAVLVLEAMKMQNEIKSPQAGKVIELGLKPGDYVEAGAVLFSVE
ncbi:MAG: biotin/lipoyl-containing protein [Candidatus Aminicenantales bacterium]